MNDWIHSAVAVAYVFDEENGSEGCEVGGRYDDSDVAGCLDNEYLIISISDRMSFLNEFICCSVECSSDTRAFNEFENEAVRIPRAEANKLLIRDCSPLT